MIILELLLYSKSDIKGLIDFSLYPVKIFCTADKIREIRYDDVEPACFKDDIYKKAVRVSPYRFELDGMIPSFDSTKVYPDSTLLIYYGGHGGHIDTTLLKFRKSFIDKYHQQRSLLPGNFDSAHLRATDHYDQNLTRDLANLENFIKDKSAVYLATDNMSLMESLANKYPQIIKSSSYKKLEAKYKSLHHTFGASDPECLSNALVDILICASADNFLPSVGGFSRLMQKLHEDKELLNRLILS